MCGVNVTSVQLLICIKEDLNENLELLNYKSLFLLLLRPKFSQVSRRFKNF